MEKRVGLFKRIKESKVAGLGITAESIRHSVWVVDLTSRTPPYDRCLCEAMHDAGTQVELWAAGSGNPELLDRVNIPLRRGWIDFSTQLPVTETTGPFIKILKAIEYLINLIALIIAAEKEIPEIIHFQWLPLLDIIPIEIALVKFLKWRGFNVVYTAHDIVPLDRQTAPRSYYILYSTVDAVVCHTKQARRRLIDEFDVDESSIRVIPHGPLMVRDSFPTRRDAREHLKWSPNQTVVLLFGVLRPYKGAEFLLRAWKRVSQQVDTARLLITGYASPWYARKLQDLVERLGISTSVETHFRFLPEDELYALIAASDVIVYPYRNITQSGALFAGMNAGKAIVATEVGGLAEVIQDGQTGILVNYGAEDDLSTSLVTLLRDPELRARYGRSAREDLDSRYSWSEIAEQTLQCYQGLL